MLKGFKFISFSLSILGAFSILHTSNAVALTADDVVCDKCIDTTDVKWGAISTGKLKNNAVKTNKIKDGNVTNSKLANDAVTSAKVKNESLTGSDILNNSLTTNDIATNAVETDEIRDGTILNADISSLAAIAISKISGDVGIEYNNIGSCINVPVSPAVLNCGSITVTAPGAGYIFLILNGGVITFGQSTVAKIGIGTTNNTFNLNYVRNGVLDGTDSIRRRTSVATSAVYYVARGGSYTFYANANRDSVFSSKQANADRLYFSALFVPKRY